MSTKNRKTNRRTGRAFAFLLLVSLMLVVSIGIASVALEGQFVTKAKYEKMLAEKDAEIVSLQTTIAKSDQLHQQQTANIQNDNMRMKEELAVFYQKEKYFKEVIKIAAPNHAKKFKSVSRGGERQTEQPVNYRVANQSSGITEEEVRMIIPGTRFANHADEIIAADKRGVNAFFTMSVGWRETQYGETTIMNNGFGERTAAGPFRRFDNLGDSIQSFSSFITKGYFNRGATTPQSISNRYCTSNPNWGNEVSNKMNELYEIYQRKKAEQLAEQFIMEFGG